MAVLGALLVAGSSAMRIRDEDATIEDAQLTQATDDDSTDNTTQDAQSTAQTDSSSTTEADSSSSAAAATSVGIDYKAHGTGALCQSGQTASVHYTGSLVSDGSVFDSSVKRGEPIDFKIGDFRVISCWEQMIV